VRIAVVGCGAIGGLYAAHLAQLPQLEVWAYDVSAAHVEAINRDGLRVTGHVSLGARVHATSDPDEIPACQFGIVAVKGMFTADAIAACAPSFADAAVCSVQNGIGNEEVIAEHVPRVMRGVTLPAARVAGPGHVHMDGAGTTWIGPFEPRPAHAEEVERLGALLNACGMDTRALRDARGAQWTKLLFNCATNPLCALTGLTHGELCELPDTRRVVGELLSEGRAVADALGIVFEEDPEELVDRLGRANYDHKPSMLQDVLARRPTEIGTLNEALVAQARACGVPAPVNAVVADLIRGVERSWTAVGRETGDDGSYPRTRSTLPR
jgi:2-dehydropantoate 2-reductase